MSEKAKVVVRRYFEEFHNGRAREIISEIISEDLIDPTSAAAQAVEMAFPDYHITVEALLGEDDVVTAVWAGEGTHEGSWSSPIGVIASTGQKVTWTATTTLRVTDGKIAELVGSNWDHLGILQQMGVVESKAPRPGA